MILKIQREVENQNWWIIDNIRKISLGNVLRMTRCALEQYVKESFDEIIIMDKLTESNKEVQCVSDSTDMLSAKRLICRDTKGEEFSILFDTIAYLCNDEGKTVEKIVAE